MVRRIAVVPMPANDGSNDNLSNGFSEDQPDKTLIEKYTEIPLYTALKPLWLSLHICGLHFVDPGNVERKITTEGGHRKKSRWTPAKCICVCILVILWLNFGRTFFLFGGSNEFGPELFMKLLVCTWMLLCALNASICAYISANRQCLSDVLFTWHDINPKFSTSGKQYIRKRVTAYVIICWVFIVANMMFTVYGSFFTNMFDYSITPMPTNLGMRTSYVRVAYCVMHLLLSCTWILPVVLYYCFCSIAYYAYKNLNTVLAKKLDEKGGVIEDLECLRRRYIRICKLVSHMDNFQMFFIAVQLTCPIICLCLIMYNIIWYEALRDPVALAMSFFWFVSSLINMIIISVGAAYVNHAAHASADTLHSIAVTSVSIEESLQITMFLNKVSGPPIGLTAMGMFVIDKPTILTILGMLITYFIVLVQFRSPTASATGQCCNCTNLWTNTTF